jgi:hypothetical protein
MTSTENQNFETNNGLLGMNKCVILKLMINHLKNKIRKDVLKYILENIQYSNDRNYITKYDKRMNFYNKNKDKFAYYIKYHHDNSEECVEFDNKYSLSLDIPTKFID